MREKESATFLCEVPQPSTEATWFKEETRLCASAKYGIEEEGTERRLTVRNVSADDDAVYICETQEGSRTVAELAVQGRRGGARGQLRGGSGGKEAPRREAGGARPDGLGGHGDGQGADGLGLRGTSWDRGRQGRDWGGKGR